MAGLRSGRDVDSLASFYDACLGRRFSKIRRVLIEAIADAGRLARRAYGTEQAVEAKDQRDFSTATDKAVEASISKRILSRFPSHSIMGEETGARGKSRHVWVVDPIDGTTNFMIGIPFFAVSIGVMVGRHTLLGAVYDPVRDEIFLAQKGSGTWVGHDRVSVSRTRELINATLGLDLYYAPGASAANVAVMRRLIPLVRTQRVLGCAALGLAYVSCGRLDAYYHNFVFPWDAAAGRLLVTEAGGRVTRYDGGDYHPLGRGKDVVASNTALHAMLLGRLS